MRRRRTETLTLSRVERHRYLAGIKIVVVYGSIDIIFTHSLQITAYTEGDFAFLVKKKETWGGGILECEVFA